MKMKVENSVILEMALKSIYNMYLDKAKIKKIPKRDINFIISYITGYTNQQLDKIIKNGTNFKAFFLNAPQIESSFAKQNGIISPSPSKQTEEILMRYIYGLDVIINNFIDKK